ncbi:3-hydroxyacyl-ACP dehydratase [Niabella ginsengisoli]|uniref:3-hydroxyacyl-ACP dehydratase n=1 Tax=Niabella ginsengisoli TaxID=522298 RepID=A0ABS9SNE9_9BACT|nr:3-hydroxyacyl-ACP dehydratase [Niabella ginsengisoli]MCH5599889.1 3-hydroxyacyl-ACP dehydratase [Niabella ginsengisoli]
MSISKNILSYIPQRDPFVMIDTLETCSDNAATTTFTVRADNIFLKDGKLCEPALVENIAQTAAARMGYICQQEQKPVPVGFIGAVQNLKITNLPKTGDLLTTAVTIKNQIFNATIIEGAISINEEYIVSCEMKIFIS